MSLFVCKWNVGKKRYFHGKNFLVIGKAFFQLLKNGSRAIASEENCPPTPKLTLSQTLTLTEGQFSLGAIVWFPPNPKINPDLDPNPKPNRRLIFLGGQLSGYLKKQFIKNVKKRSSEVLPNSWSMQTKYILTTEAEKFQKIIFFKNISPYLDTSE